MKRMMSLLITFFCFSMIVFTQNNEMKSSGFTADILAELEFAQGQVLQLVEAIPEDKFSWRPSEGVRSISEVYMHIAEGNYFLLTFLGGSMPEGYKQDWTTTVTKKADVIENIKKSYAYTKEILAKYNEENLEKPVDFFGNKSNQRRMILVLLYHNHEHLGQSVAYARMNGITPPWNMASANK